MARPKLLSVIDGLGVPYVRLSVPMVRAEARAVAQDIPKRILREGSRAGLGAMRQLRVRAGATSRA